MLTEKQIKALDRLSTKLSSVRKTLRGDERDLLDRIVTSAVFEIEAGEVAAHAMKSAKVANAEVAAHKMAGSKVAAPEVVAHKMSGAKVAAPEVAAHKMSGAKVSHAEVAAHKLSTDAKVSNAEVKAHGMQAAANTVISLAVQNGTYKRVSDG